MQLLLLMGGYTFPLRKFCGEHTCQANEKDMYKQCTAPWVANALEDEFRTHPTYRPEDIQAEIMSRHGVHISYWTAWSARVTILENINGNYEEGYRLQSELCRQVQNKNPGTIARWFCTKNTREFLVY
ncbi:hypothetical protein IFM89_036025 [Coptis chinensis]|uniref:Uncharacterized protein n=1 Tax=Coptis chinensis TaxID=261450 RepID=A0A835HB31_9MAGN|nr:hypothetical protein IFM89_036025 [Coptis chinensis]